MVGIKEGASLITLILGLVSGIGFGLIIFKVGASKYDDILNMLRLKNLKILKFMITTVVVASIGIYAMEGAGMIALSVKPVWLWAQIIGGGIFGIGFAVSGYCPGTSMVAIGEGKKDAIFTVLGGLVGAAVFAHFWPWLSTNIINPGDLGSITVSSALSISNWSAVLLVAAVFGGILVAVEFFERRSDTVEQSQKNLKEAKASAK